MTKDTTDENSKKPYKKTRIGLTVILVVLVALVGVRAYLPIWVKDYVNRQINALEGYGGGVEDIDLYLWRGAYQIKGLNIHKTGSDIPIPFVNIATTDLSLQWRALFKGAVVAEIDMYNADLNFAVGSTGESQTGEGAGWAALADRLSPLDINRLTVNGGRLSFNDYSGEQPIDLFIDDIALRVDNLRAVEADDAALPSPITLSGQSIGKGKLSASGNLNIVRDTPDFDLEAKLENAWLPAINDYSRSLAAVDFVEGNLSVYSELAAKDGAITGYVKPIITDINMVSLEQDSNPINLIWESVVSVFAEILTNQPNDQFATQIPISGQLESPSTNTWTTLMNVLRNTFNAYLKETNGTIDFSAFGNNEDQN